MISCRKIFLTECRRVFDCLSRVSFGVSTDDIQTDIAWKDKRFLRCYKVGDCNRFE